MLTVYEDSDVVFESLKADTAPALISGSLNDVISVFAETNACQTIFGTGNYTVLASPSSSKIVGKFAAAPVPMGMATPETVLFGWLIALPTHSPNPTGGAKFLMYALSPSHLQTFVKEGAPPPGRISLLASPAISKELPYLSVLESQEAVARHYPYIPQIPEVISDVSQQLNSISTGGISLLAGLRKVESQVNSLLQQ